MLYDVIDMYFSNIPMVLCADGAFVAEGNAAACSRLKHLSEGETLFSHMTPFDALRFEAAYDCTSDELLTFPLKGYHGFHFAAAAFEKLMGRRFATVYLFQNKKECDIFCQYYKNREQVGRQSQERISSFMSAITGIDSTRFSGPEDEGLFDLKAVTARALQDMTSACDFLDCETTFVQNKEAEGKPCIPSAVKIGNYIKMLMCMVYVLNDLTTSRKIEVKLCNYGEESELRMSTYTEKLPVGVSDLEGLIDSMPSCATRLTLCQYVAGCCGGTLQARTMQGTGQILLILTLSPCIPGDVDLKSRDQFYGYQTVFDRTADWIRKIG